MNSIDLQIRESIATITLQNPGGNRITFEMRRGIFAAVDRVANSRARVLLVRADGDDFCLGGDIHEWLGIPSAELQPRIEMFAKALDLIGGLAIPTVALVQGRCVGGGFELALSCDLIVAGNSAQFAFPEATVGLTTLQGGVYRLAERIGRARAIELVMLPTSIPASQMNDWNVINKVVDDGALLTAGDELAQRLASGPPEAYAATKAVMQIWGERGALAAREALYDISMPLFDLAGTQTAIAEAITAAGGGAFK